jgi:hypothetical protein
MITANKQMGVFTKNQERKEGVRGLESAELIRKTYGFPLIKR